MSLRYLYLHYGADIIETKNLSFRFTTSLLSNINRQLVVCFSAIADMYCRVRIVVSIE